MTNQPERLWRVCCRRYPSGKVSRTWPPQIIGHATRSLLALRRHEDGVTNEYWIETYPYIQPAASAPKDSQEEG